MNKKIFIGALVLILIVGGLFWFIQSRKAKPSGKPSIQAHELIATVTKIEGDTVFANGQLVIEGEQTSPQSPKDFQISLNSATKFNKTTLVLPTKEEQAKMGGFFTSDQLKKEIKSVTADEFKTDLGANKIAITIHADQNIYNVTSFPASSIDYTLADSAPTK